jgi:hypothetical protein
MSTPHRVATVPVRNGLKVVVHVLAHAATILIGMILFILGLGMTMTIVFATAGIVVMVVGGLLVVGGLFAHAAAGP